MHWLHNEGCVVIAADGKGDSTQAINVWMVVLTLYRRLIPTTALSRHRERALDGPVAQRPGELAVRLARFFSTVLIPIPFTWAS